MNILRISRRSAVSGLATIAMCMSGGTASADANRTDAVGRRYLALGDSLAFGFSPLLEDPWIPKRFVGYPEVIGRWTGVQTTNLACPGQTAQALVSRDAVDAGCFDFRDRANEQGIKVLHADYMGTQLDAALDAVRSATPPSLISIQGGGNDWALCEFDSPDPEQCLAETLPRVTASLLHATRHLRAAGYRGQVVLVGYHLVPDFEASLRRVNGAIEQAARRSNVAFADTAVLFAWSAQRHHGDLCLAGLLVKLAEGSCDPLHPSATGHHLVAAAVLAAAMARHR